MRKSSAEIAVTDDHSWPRREAVASEPIHRVWIGTVLAAGMAALLGVAVVGLPREHAPLPFIARYALSIALPRWGLTEPVNEIVYGTRGFDTFGETFLLLAAVVSVIVLSRGREARRGYVGEEQAAERERAASDPEEPESADERRARKAELAEEKGTPRPENPDDERLGSPPPETAAAMSADSGGCRSVSCRLGIFARGRLSRWGGPPWRGAAPVCRFRISAH
jgi:multicomponent Na+:H+ antiporter subunit B